MSMRNEKSKQKSFYLHSFKNRRLYPASNYPITHLVDHLNIKYRILEQSKNIKYFIYAFIILIMCILIGMIYFQLNIKIYNTMFGPFHFNEGKFIKYIKEYNEKKSFLSQFWEKEYVQMELNEYNIQNPSTTYDTIRPYSDPQTRRNHITTYKQTKRPSIYVKLPTQSQEYFHKHYPIRFQLYSIRTLQCIIKNLPLGSTDIYQTWIEKSNYIEYIHEKYAKNSTEFNKSVLTKCGLLIGHLYRPFYEEAFVRTHQYKFLSSDIALNMTEKHDPFSLFLSGGLIFLWFFYKSLFYIISYLLNNIRLKFYQQISIFSFSLKLSPDIIEELWLLNIDGFPHEQLLKLDELIQQTDYKFKDNLFIIKNNNEHLFVVILKKIDLNINNESSPFIICPVTDIQKITEYGCICFGEKFSLIPWPTNEQDYADWLHEQLIEISDFYKKHYGKTLRYDSNNEQLSYFTDQSLNYDIGLRRRIYSKQLLINTINEYNRQLSNLIHEENIQLSNMVRENIAETRENIKNGIIPASVKFIARFRLKDKYNKKIANINMIEKQIQCTICQENFELNDQYATWPCPREHIFHYECILKWLRMRNTCPNCRHEVEGVPLASIQAMVT